MNAELPALVRAAQEGDKEAFGQIVGRFQDMAFASAYALLGNAMLAQDAAQDAFVDAFRTLHLLREPAAFPGWFRRIIFKHSDRQVRGKPLTLAPLEAAYDMRSPQPGPHDLLEEALLRQDVDGAIQLLPANQRMVVSLFYIEGYSQAEIADFLEIPVTAVKKRLFNARNNLRERIIPMVQETLQANRPSQSDEFVDKVTFYIALRENDLGQVTALLDGEPALATMTIDRCEGIPSYYWPVGVTPLNWAAGTGNVTLLDLLLARGADINVQPKPNAMTPLHEAINMHQTDLVSTLLERGANVNATAHGGQTPLHYAVHKNNPRVAELLLKAGAQVDVWDASGRTAIDWAVAYDRPILVELLTAHGAAKPKAYKAMRRAETAPTPDGRRVPVGSAVMGRVLNGHGEAVNGDSLADAIHVPVYRPTPSGQSPILATGIKIIDLFAPIKRGGHNALFTSSVGVGKMVVLGQLVQRMVAQHGGCAVCMGLNRGGFTGESLMLGWRDLTADGQLLTENVVCVYGDVEDDAAARLQVAETGLTIAEQLRQEGRNVLLLVDDMLALSKDVLPYLRANAVATPEAAITLLYDGPHTPGLEPDAYAHLDTIMAFDRGRANQMLYPAIDPLRSRSKLLTPELVGAEHMQVLHDMRRIFTRYAELHPLFEKMGAEAPTYFEDPGVVQDAQRARRLHRFLTQPLPGIETFTNLPGVYVSREDAMRGCRAILDGQYDALPEEAFYMVGTIEQAVEKAKEL